jgi:hypothetical protein
MEQNYDFSKIGKQMPYTVPDGFFDKLEENLMNEVKAQPAQKEKATAIRMAIRAAIAIAACIALFLVVKKVLPQDTTTDDFTNVELAFNNLSTDDQDYLLEVYQEELLLENDLNY